MGVGKWEDLISELSGDDMISKELQGRKKIYIQNIPELTGCFEFSKL